MEQEGVPSVAIPKTSPKLSLESLVSSVRRSSRNKKGVKKYEDEDFILSPSKSDKNSASSDGNTTRPKRKAAVAAFEANTTEDGAVLLDQILTCMAEDERKEYKGWVELESEPVRPQKLDRRIDKSFAQLLTWMQGFFNAMLNQLGAQDFKIQELFGVDEFSRSLLPEPVYGLIYLSQYTNQTTATDEGRQDCPPHLWFGNQTTTNACATVALMNIIMNANGTTLEPELQHFKDATRPLMPALRGNLLDKNDFIRSIHNSVARRKDLLAEDLALDNKMEAAEKKYRNHGKKKPTRTNNNRSRLVPEQTFHYIAYVHVDGEVWELDGFEIRPLCHGASTEDKWLQVASEAIQKKMLVNEDLQCSLLAVCHSPLKRIINDLSANEALLQKLSTTLQKTTGYAFASEALTGDPALAAAVVSSAETVKLDAALLTSINEGQFSREELEGMNNNTQAQQVTLMAEYNSEMATRNHSHDMMHGRQQDYTPAIHRWVQLLAEKGMLRELTMGIESESHSPK